MDRQSYRKTFSELSKLKTFDERFAYLCLHGLVGDLTFGSHRYLNQMLYKCPEWRDDFRPMIIERDNGCDLGIPGREIPNLKYCLVHHINPVTVEDVLNRAPCVFDPENVITTILKTHNAIHYGSIDSTYRDPIERKPNDTIPWR